jgi:hypothetical protein
MFWLGKTHIGEFVAARALEDAWSHGGCRICHLVVKTCLYHINNIWLEFCIIEKQCHDTVCRNPETETEWDGSACEGYPSKIPLEPRGRSQCMLSLRLCIQASRLLKEFDMTAMDVFHRFRCS